MELPKAMTITLSVLIIILECCNGLHFGNPFEINKLALSASPLPLIRLRRETQVKHKTQHLKPAIEIEPLPNQKVKVAMPTLNARELTAFATQAQAAIDTRFSQLEPTLFASNGKFIIR